MGNWYAQLKVAMPRWYDFKETLTLYHGTSSALLPIIQQEGIKPPDAELMRFAISVVTSYFPDATPNNHKYDAIWNLVKKHAISFRDHQHLTTGGSAIFLSPTFEQAAGYSKFTAPHGGEIAYEIYRYVKWFCETKKLPVPPPRFSEARPIVLEVEVPYNWLNGEKSGPNTPAKLREMYDRIKKLHDDPNTPQTELIKSLKEEGLEAFMEGGSRFEARITHTIPPQMIKAVHDSNVDPTLPKQASHEPDYIARGDPIAKPKLKFLYHGTRGENQEAILRDGLKCSGVQKMWSDTANGYVHLTETLHWAHKWVLHAYRKNPEVQPGIKPTIVILQVEVAGLDMKLMEQDYIGMAGDWRYKGDIPANLISVANRYGVNTQTL